MNKSDFYFRELDQRPPAREVRMPKQPKDSIDAGEDYYTWLNREYGRHEGESR